MHYWVPIPLLKKQSVSFFPKTQYCRNLMKKKKPPFKLPFLKLVKNGTLSYLRFLGKNVCMFCLQDHKSFFLKENSLTINNTNDASLTGKHLMTLKSSRGTDICNQNETCITYFFISINFLNCHAIPVLDHPILFNSLLSHFSSK